jgi:hypothetical protein
VEVAEAHRQAAVKEKEAKESEARRQAVRQTIASYREDISNLLARLGLEAPELSPNSENISI